MYYCGRGALAQQLLLGGADAEAMGRFPDFALPGDTAVYAPDRPADVRHVEIDVTLDFETDSVQGVVTTQYAALFDTVREVTLDATELAIEQVTMAGKKSPLTYWSEGDKLHIRLDRDYRHGQQFGVTVRYSAHPRTGLVFVHPMEGNPDLPTQAWTQGQTSTTITGSPATTSPTTAPPPRSRRPCLAHTSRSPTASSTASPRSRTARKRTLGGRISRIRHT